VQQLQLITDYLQLLPVKLHLILLLQALQQVQLQALPSVQFQVQVFLMYFKIRQVLIIYHKDLKVYRLIHQQDRLQYQVRQDLEHIQFKQHLRFNQLKQDSFGNLLYIEMVPLFQI
jgi:hypothetical protein